MVPYEFHIVTQPSHIISTYGPYMAQDLPYHSHTFCLVRLQQSGFYWGAITAVQAKFLLRDQAVGKFLVRDIWDPKHLFTITLVTNTGITNVRIIFCKSLFSLDEQESFTWRKNGIEGKKQCTPRFDCVVEMIVFYMLSTQMVRQAKGQSRTGQIFFLLSPLYKGISSLRSLCRKTLNRMPFFKKKPKCINP